jgi:hypothetical protein
LTTWSEILGIGRGTLWSRLNVYGFSIEKSFTLPLHEGNRGSK